MNLNNFHLEYKRKLRLCNLSTVLHVTQVVRSIETPSLSNDIKTCCDTKLLIKNLWFVKVLLGETTAYFRKTKLISQCSREVIDESLQKLYQQLSFKQKYGYVFCKVSLLVIFHILTLYQPMQIFVATF